MPRQEVLTRRGIKPLDRAQQTAVMAAVFIIRLRLGTPVYQRHRRANDVTGIGHVAGDAPAALRLLDGPFHSHGLTPFGEMLREHQKPVRSMCRGVGAAGDVLSQTRLQVRGLSNVVPVQAGAEQDVGREHLGPEKWSGRPDLNR